MRPLIKTEADSIGGWGDVPAQDGNLATVTPNPSAPTAPTTTTIQQSDSAATTAVVQRTLLPPPPPPNACVAGDSFTPSFYTWLLQLQRRVGGFVATPSDDAQVLADISETVDQSARSSADALALFDMDRGQFQQVSTVADFWSDDSGRVYLSGDQQIYGAKTWMGRVGFFGTAAATKPAALTAAAAAAPAGGAGTAAGGWDTALNRDAAITTINNLRTRLSELESRLQSLGLLT